MTAEERIAAGHNMTIFAAVQCAGGFSRVARMMGLSLAAPRAWVRTGNVPEKHREELCRIGGHAFRPEQLGKAGAK